MRLRSFAKSRVLRYVKTDVYYWHNGDMPLNLMSAYMHVGCVCGLYEIKPWHALPAINLHRPIDSICMLLSIPHVSFFQLMHLFF